MQRSSSKISIPKFCVRLITACLSGKLQPDLYSTPNFGGMGNYGPQKKVDLDWLQYLPISTRQHGDVGWIAYVYTSAPRDLFHGPLIAKVCESPHCPPYIAWL